MCACHCQSNEKLFNSRRAESDLANYQADGLPHTTAVLLDQLKQLGVAGKSILDIGGGVGMISFELLTAGASQATSVEGSSHFTKVAQAEAKRRGLSSQTKFLTGDFVDLADHIPAADFVTLDKVTCCYPDLPALVTAATKHARLAVGLIYPRDTWWVKVMHFLPNIWLRLRSLPPQYMHSNQAIADILEQHGFSKHFTYNKKKWQVAVFNKNTIN